MSDTPNNPTEPTLEPQTDLSGSHWKTWAIVAMVVLVAIGVGVGTVNRHRAHERTMCYYPKAGDKTEVFNVVIVDMSASMDRYDEAVVTGLNELIHALRTVQDEIGDSQQHYLTMSLVNTEMFNDIRFNEPVGRVACLSPIEFTPCNSTPLVDAVGMTLDWMRAYTDSVQDYAVMVTIITDGFENSSADYSLRQVGDTIQKLQQDPHWDFAFLGTDNEAMKQGRFFHIDNCRLFRYDGDSSLRSFAAQMNQLRRLANHAKERKQQMTLREDGGTLTLQMLRERKAEAVVRRCATTLNNNLLSLKGRYPASITIEEKQVVLSLEVSGRTWETFNKADQETQQYLMQFLVNTPEATHIELLRAIRVAHYNYLLRLSNSETGEVGEYIFKL